MTQRASSMLRLERSRLTSLDPSISHSIETIDKMQPVWSAEPAQLLNRAVVLSSETQTSLVSDTCCWLTLMGDDSRYGDQFASPLASVKQDFDYVLVVPIDAFRGRMRISVKSSTGKTYSTAIVEAFEPISTADHGVQRIALTHGLNPFAAIMELCRSHEADHRRPDQDLPSISPEPCELTRSSPCMNPAASPQAASHSNQVLAPRGIPIRSVRPSS